MANPLPYRLDDVGRLESNIAIIVATLCLYSPPLEVTPPDARTSCEFAPECRFLQALFGTAADCRLAL